MFSEADPNPFQTCSVLTTLTACPPPCIGMHIPNKKNVKVGLYLNHFFLKTNMYGKNWDLC